MSQLEASVEVRPKPQERLLELAQEEGKSADLLLDEMMLIYKVERIRRSPSTRSVHEALARSWKHAEKSGTAEMSTEEINAEIAECRTGR